MNWARGTHRRALVLAGAWLAGCSCQDSSTDPAVLSDLAHVFPLDHLAEAQLDDGDLAVTTDYRDVLGEILLEQMGATSLGGVFPGLSHQPIGIVG